MDTPEKALDIVNLGISYGSTQVVSGMFLQLGRGDILALTGPNGSGKTSVLKACAGILGSNAKITGSIHGQAVYVGDDLTCEFALTVRDILALADHHRSVRGVTVPAAMDQFCLEPLAGLTLSELSHGQRQRVNLGRAWIQGSPVLLLDESLSALDAASRKHALTLITERAARRLSTVLVSHDPTLLEIATQKYMVAPNA